MTHRLIRVRGIWNVTQFFADLLIRHSMVEAARIIDPFAGTETFRFCRNFHLRPFGV